MKTRDGIYRRSDSILRIILVCSAILAITFREAEAQRLSAYGGLGVNYYQANSITNFLNASGIGNIKPGGFTSAIQFSIGAGYAVTAGWELGIDYAYMIDSFSGNSGAGSQQVSLSYSLPSLTIHRLIKGEGYSFRFGGAFGYHFGSISISSPYSSRTQDYSGRGVGVKLDASIDTKLDEKLYVRVGVHALSEFIDQPKASDGTGLTYTDYNSGNQDPVKMNLIGVGVSLGLVYYF